MYEALHSTIGDSIEVDNTSQHYLVSERVYKPYRYLVYDLSVTPISIVEARSVNEIYVNRVTIFTPVHRNFIGAL